MKANILIAEIKTRIKKQEYLASHKVWDLSTENYYYALYLFERNKEC